MLEALNYLNSLDFKVGGFEPDGRMHRFGRNGSKDSAWYIAWQNARMNSGEFYYVVVFGDWKTGEHHTYKPKGVSRAEGIAIDEQIRQRQADIQKERERIQLEVADKAEKRFSSAAKEGITPYMVSKGITNLYGCCTYQDRLQVPMRDAEGMIWGMQTIMADGAKFFMKGQRKKECHHVIGGTLAEDAIVFVVEGFATGVSVHLATEKVVVVAFDAGNLFEVVGALVKKYPKMSITICGDDDRFNDDNPGRKKAEKAAMLASGAVVFPKFPDSDKKSTDFNDLHLRYSLKEVHDQILGTPIEQKTGYIPLGYDEATHFFYHVPSKDIVKASTFVPSQMYRIAPMEFWEARYPTKKGTADLHKAMHDLVQVSSQVGPFDTTRIRGTGVWLDQNRVVVNTGHSLIVDGKETSLSALSSWFIYVQTRNRIPPLHQKPLTAAEGKEIVRTCMSFRWKNTNDAFLLSGWLAMARIAAALPVRPHIWLTGGKGTGKSTLMESFIAPLLGGPKGKIHVIGATTEAGIRQAAKSSAVPVIWDEFESTGIASRNRIESVVELFRNAWSTSQGKVLKGSSGGSSVEFQLSFAALVSSIRVKLENDADRSRFSVLELDNHGDSAEQWRSLCVRLAMISEELGERLFARMCKFVPEVLECFKVIAPILAAAESQRYGQQVGMQLSSLWMLENDDVVGTDEAKALCGDFVESVRDEDREELADEYECLLHLTTGKVRFGDKEIGLGEAIQCAAAPKSNSNADHAAFLSTSYNDLLRLYGIKIVGSRFWIANRHTELEKLYKPTRWSGNWSRSLKRLPDAKSEGITAFAKARTRVISLPISLLA